jgi:hypothetical protein
MDSLPQKIVGMSNEEYQTKKGYLRRSYLHSVCKYGGEAQQWLDSGRSLFSGSAATTLGSKFDQMVTGEKGLCNGNDIESQLAVPPADVLASNGARRGGKFDAWKAEAEKQGLIDCSNEEREKLLCMGQSLLANPAAVELIRETVETQVSVFFELYGQPCMVRPDGCCADRWWDLKSTSATWDKIHFSVNDYGYAMQEFLYVEAAKAIGLPHHRMPFVFVQTMAPFACRVFLLPEDMVEEAGRQLRNVMEEVRLRRETGVYLPVEHGEITEMVVPAWANKKTEEVLI